MAEPPGAPQKANFICIMGEKKILRSEPLGLAPIILKELRKRAFFLSPLYRVHFQPNVFFSFECQKLNTNTSFLFEFLFE